MRIEVINTGTELLLGGTLNTHAAWIGKSLFPLGLRISRQVTVPDGDVIRDVLSEAVRRADVVIVTGGLGPTSDDLSREITAEVLGLHLIEDELALRNLEAFFAARGKTMAADNLKQALIPKGADMLPNANGTAPGVYISSMINPVSHCAVFLLPGPPRELYPMFQNEVFPRLKELSGNKTESLMLEMKFTGVGESDLHAGVDSLLAEIRGMEYGYCAHMGEVDLRLMGSREVISQGRDLALRKFGRFLVSEDGSSLEERVVSLLTEKRMTLAIAESCTGGLIANRITNVPGASAVFPCSFVTYSNESKVNLLGVSLEDITKYGAVSETVACQMAAGALGKSGADIAVAVTGIAGPDGGCDEKPVGTAWIGLAEKGSPAQAFRVFQPRNRLDFKQIVSQEALAEVMRKLI